MFLIYLIRLTVNLIRINCDECYSKVCGFCKYSAAQHRLNTKTMFGAVVHQNHIHGFEKGGLGVCNQPGICGKIS